LHRPLVHHSTDTCGITHPIECAGIIEFWRALQHLLVIAVDLVTANLGRSQPLQIEAGHFTDEVRNRGHRCMEALRNLRLGVVRKVSRYADLQFRNWFVGTF
jgi:hypothetical protein